MKNIWPASELRSLQAWSFIVAARRTAYHGDVVGLFVEEIKRLL